MTKAKEELKMQFAGVEVETPSAEIEKVGTNGTVSLHFSNKMRVFKNTSSADSSSS